MKDKKFNDQDVITLWNNCKNKAMITSPKSFLYFLQDFLEASSELSKEKGIDLDDLFHLHKHLTEPLLDKFEKDFNNSITNGEIQK